jgi:DNA helicase II / ATP-dependent DNA helicase PcrA
LQTTDSQIHSVTAQQLLDKLNADQKQAVCLGFGPSLVVAGAGSGKTTVLTRRVAYLLSELKQPAYSIMAVTFTNKAAAEMKHRIEGLVGQAVGKRLTIGTFHSICARLLRREIAAYESPEGFKWKSNFVIYDETDTLSVVKGVVQRLNLDEKAFPPKEVRHKISAAKNDGINSFHFAKEARNYRDSRLSEVFTQYQSELARNNALDFDDLIAIFTDLLEQNAELRQRITDTYRHLLVDEFQDTNQSQYRLIRLLSFDDNPKNDEERVARWENRSLMVVGDVDQSIYSWRKADFRIILGFQNDFTEAALIKLEENYRSTGTILAVANSIIINNTERLDKVLRCNRGEGGKARCYQATDEIDEAFFVVEEIKRLAARSISPADSCILYRTNAQSRAIEEVLIRTGLPYTMVGGTRFYDRAEIKDVIAYLKLVYNEADGQSFNRIVNNPRRGLGKTTLEKLADHAERNNMSMLAASKEAPTIKELSGKAGRTLADFAQAITRWQNMSTVMGVASLVDLILKESTYLAKLEEEAHQTKDEIIFGRVENVRELMAVAQEFESIADEPTLEAFLTRISLVSDLDRVDLQQEAVKLMTLHSAKGLEFPTVFLVGLEEGLFPHIRSINSPTALEEERRLMYVGVTRAQDRLYLTFSRHRSLYGNTSATIPSRFLSEISSQCLQGFDADPESAFRAGSTDRSAETFVTGYNRSSSDTTFGGAQDGGSSQSSGPGYSRTRYDDDQPHQQMPPAKPRVLSRSKPSDLPADKESIKPAANFEHLAIGDSVMHATFGVGKVTQVIGSGDKELYNVEFQTAGKRLMDPRFAKLVKIS